MTTPNQPEHSVEPWSYTGEDDGDFIVWSGEDFVGNIGAAMQRVGVIIDLDRANARRIVACVNACKDVATADLEEIGEHFGGVYADAKRRIATLERQRRELVEVLRGCDAYLCSSASKKIQAGSVLHQGIQAALASAGEGSSHD